MEKTAKEDMLNPQTVFSWTAPLRPYKKRSGVILRFYVAVTLLLSLIVFFFGDKILLIPIWSLLFLFYVLTITPPPDVENKITKFGLESAGVTLRWESLSHFYFSRRFGYNVLTIVGHAPYYFYAFLVVPNNEIKQKLIFILSEHLIYQEKPQRTVTDKMIDWLSSLIPDEEETQVSKPLEVASAKGPAVSL